MSRPQPTADFRKFEGDNAALVAAIMATISVSDRGAAWPHGLSEWARTLLEEAAKRLDGPDADHTPHSFTRAPYTQDTCCNCGNGADHPVHVGPMLVFMPGTSIVPDEDFLKRLRRVGAERSKAWTGDDQPDDLFFATELGGEVGEVLNIVKKLYRERRGWRGSRATMQQLREEIGDVLISLNNLAAVHDIDLEEVAAEKFDATSRAVGLPYFIGPAIEAAAIEHTDFGKFDVVSAEVGR